MSVTWLAPAAFVGLALLLVPLLVHLLARQHSERVPFPSLRFLPDAQLAALRRHVVTDWPLLAVRMAVIAAAVAAAAAPVFVSASRKAAWSARFARAVIVAQNPADVGDARKEAAGLVEQERRASFVSAVFEQAQVADSLRAAADWLHAQPPASREVVVVGDLTEGTIAAADFGMLPPHVGIRFLPIVADRRPGMGELRAVTDVGGRATPMRLTVEPTPTRTRVEYRADSGAALPPIRILASESQQAFADALLRAVLREGVTFDSDRDVVIVFEGSTDYEAATLNRASQPYMREVLERIPHARGGEANGSLIVRAMMAVTDPRAPQFVADVVHRVFAPSFDQFEVRDIEASTLAQWSRPATGSPADTLPADEHDRRWFWGLALVLLGVEQVLRRRRRSV